MSNWIADGWNADWNESTCASSQHAWCVSAADWAATHLRNVPPLRLVCSIFFCILVGSSGLCRGGQVSAGTPPPGLGQQLHSHHIPINGPADRARPSDWAAAAAGCASSRGHSAWTFGTGTVLAEQTAGPVHLLAPDNPIPAMLASWALQPWGRGQQDVLSCSAANLDETDLAAAVASRRASGCMQLSYFAGLTCSCRCAH